MSAHLEEGILIHYGWCRQTGRRSLLSLWACAALVVFLISAPRVTAREEASTDRAVPLFDFHSNFWVNLHQALFYEAVRRVGKPDRRLEGTAPLSAAGMSGEERANWEAAVNFYLAHFETRPEVFDDQLIQINDALATQPDDGASLNPAGLPADLVAVLQSAAPIYREYWWAAHNQSNKNWLASEGDRIQDLGPKLAAAMTRDLHEQWPRTPIRVDVCYYVPAIGYAYTTRIPPHTTFSSSDPSNQGLSGFELLFHEASHTFSDTVRDALSAECRAQKKNCGDLWHTVLFYTSGAELRRLLPASEQASFTPYAYEYGAYTRGNWPTYRSLLETDWQAYLDGKIQFAGAIRSMVAGLQ